MTQRAKDKIFEADPNIEIFIPSIQGIAAMYGPYLELYNEKKASKASTVLT